MYFPLEKDDFGHIVGAVSIYWRNLRARTKPSLKPSKKTPEP